jgi:parvulin-like peptidyl-prolyl isomerase
MFASRPALTRSIKVAILLVATVLLGLSGCSRKSKDQIAVAEVADHMITLEYFERKMNTIPAEELPADIATASGREELLETMIKKEVMLLKAIDLGMGEDGQVDQQATRVSNLTAVTTMRNEISEAVQDVSEEEIQAYYEMLPRTLMTSYMLFGFEDVAREARALVEGGEDWETVARRFKAGAPGRQDNFTMPVSYGTVADDFERVVFALPVGAISDPIESPYGYFIIRIDDVTYERMQPLDSIREQVISSVRGQKEKLALFDFVAQVFEEYELFINDEALQVIYDGIPEDLPLTPPYPEQEELEPLTIDSSNLDMVLMSFADHVWTVRRYSDFHDGSSIFGRARREGQVGGLRRKLKEIAIRELMDQVALDRGFGERIEVEEEYHKRREQLLVSRLNEELIRDQVKVSAEELDLYWEENKEDFRTPELRDVLAVITETEAEGLSAQIDLAGGATWEDVVEKYCVPSDVREAKGKVGKMGINAESRIKEIVWSLNEDGATSEPTELEDGRWALVRVLTIEPSELPLLEDVRVTVGARVRGQKEDALFDSLIEGWKSEYTIKRYPERLMDAVYAPVEPEDHSVIVGGGG